MRGTARYRGNKQTVGPNGRVYPSKAQAVRAAELHMLLKAGVITDLEEEVDFELIPKQTGERKCSYRADFVYREHGERVVEDKKGFKTEIYRLKKKLMLQVHGIKIRET